MAEYVVHINNIEDLPDCKEVTLFIQDLAPGIRKYDGQVVKAITYSSEDKIPGADLVWMRSLVGTWLDDKPRVMKVIERLGDSVPGRPILGEGNYRQFASPIQ